MVPLRIPPSVGPIRGNRQQVCAGNADLRLRRRGIAMYWAVRVAAIGEAQLVSMPDHQRQVGRDRPGWVQPSALNIYVIGAGVGHNVVGHRCEHVNIARIYVPTGDITAGWDTKPGDDIFETIAHYRGTRDHRAKGDVGGVDPPFDTETTALADIELRATGDHHARGNAIAVEGLIDFAGLPGRQGGIVHRHVHRAWGGRCRAECGAELGKNDPEARTESGRPVTE